MLLNLFKSNPVIVAEIGVNHNGDPKLAKQLIDIALEAGADAVKFQAFKAWECAGTFSNNAEYQSNQSKNQYELLKSLELDFADLADMKEYAEKLGLIFFATPDGETSLDFLCDINTPIIKIASGELTNIPFLYAIGSKHRPVILSTGMGTLEETDRAVTALKESGVPEILLMHCTTEYPAPTEDANLKAITTMQKAFNLPVGYSDHTLGYEAAIAATALGAVMFEKHITIDKNMQGPDHAASMNPAEFKQYVLEIRRTVKMLGDGIKKPVSSELKNIPLVRRSIVAAHELFPGNIIGGHDIAIKRPATGIQPIELQNVFGKKVKVKLQKDEPITWEHLEK